MISSSKRLDLLFTFVLASLLLLGVGYRLGNSMTGVTNTFAVGSIETGDVNFTGEWFRGATNVTDNILAQPSSLNVSGVTRILGIGDGGLTSYDLLVGDVLTPDYGMIRIGDLVVGRTSYNVGNCDLNGSVVFRNMGSPPTSNIEFVFTESGGDAIRFALAKSGPGLATYNPRSMIIAGPAVLNDEVVTVGYWQTNNNIFDNLAMDTNTYGADLGVQNDLEVEGDFFIDSIIESTSGAGITLLNDTVVNGTLTVNGDQSGAADHVFDDYDDLDLLEKWRAGEDLPFETGDLLNRDRLLRDAIIQQQVLIEKLQNKIELLENIIDVMDD